MMLLLPFVAALASIASANSVPVTYFSCGPLFYRTMQWSPDGSTLWVGAMDHLFALKADNINATRCDPDGGDALHIPAAPSAVAACTSKGKSSHFDCRNHIRVIAPVGSAGGRQRLYVCGTNAHSPRDQVLYSDLKPLERHEFFPGVGDGIAKCPFDPHDNSTAVWVESGNPGGHPALYSGTNAEFTKADTVIFRGDIFDPSTGRREYSFKRTLKYDSHMLDKPDFVGSYDVGEYVYFFFRETAVEFMNCGKTIYSRVARVCKKDVGGKNILNQNWATYLKARLNCSIPGDFPFFFNEIQDVYKVPSDDSQFHAVFTTSQNGLTGSAICSFRLDAMEEVFEGKFKEQATTTSVWLPVPKAKVPEPRPGSCVPDTRKLPDTVLNFIRKHPLMDTNVPHDADEPIFYEKDVVFNTLAFEPISTPGAQSSFAVYYAGTTKGSIYKVARWTDRQGHTQSRLLDRFPVSTRGEEPIRKLELSRSGKRSLFAATDSGVHQVHLDELCSARYDSCSLCTRDPSCGWEAEKAECIPAASGNVRTLLRDPAGEAGPLLCESSTSSTKMDANFGESVHLECGQLPRQEGAQATWHHSSPGGETPVQISPAAHPSRYVQTTDQGLVVIGAHERDAGTYECRWGGHLVRRFSLRVDAHRCSAPGKSADYQKVYSQWCQEYQKYKSSLQAWEKRQNKCASTEVLMLRNEAEGQGHVYKTTPLV